MISVVKSPVFTKAFKKLPERSKVIVEDEIDKIIVNPEIGERKKGDISYMWVHKFRLNNQLMLMGYSWVEDELQIHLLHLNSHENFYRNAKNRRSEDLKAIS